MKWNTKQLYDEAVCNFLTTPQQLPLNYAFLTFKITNLKIWNSTTSQVLLKWECSTTPQPPLRYPLTNSFLPLKLVI